MGQLRIARPEIKNPNLWIALAINPSLKAWPWTGRGNAARIVNLRQVDHALKVADWMAEQDWWTEPVVLDPTRTYKFACSLAISDYTEGRTDQFEMVDRILSLVRRGARLYRKEAA